MVREAIHHDIECNRRATTDGIRRTHANEGLDEAGTHCLVSPMRVSVRPSAARDSEPSRHTCSSRAASEVTLRCGRMVGWGREL